MLNRIHIKNLAIITTLEVEFGKRMTVLTGETGAGKSILIDALGLVLGDRASSGMIRSDSERAEITGVFSLHDCPEAEKWLEDNGMDTGDECILRRVLVKEGTSRAFICGSPVPLKSMQALGALLVDIHGQHAHQSLLRKDQQRELLDEYGGTTLLCNEVTKAFRLWRNAMEDLEKLRQESMDRNDRADLLGYQEEELGRLHLEAGELENLEQELRRLSNAGQLTQQCGELLAVLYDDEDSTLVRLARAGRTLEVMAGTDAALSDCLEMLNSASVQIEETAAGLRDYGEGIEQDPLRLAQIEERLADIQDLARKYRCRPEELNFRLEEMRRELKQLAATGNRLQELEQTTKTLAVRYQEQAQELHRQRLSTASGLKKAVTDHIKTLGMPESRFEVQIDTQPEDKAGATGIDSVEFLISANPGHPPQPLAQVASGGELSRLSLGIQVATIDCTRIPTLIFDEVDVGIGGGVAEIVGRLLARLGRDRQVLCVTHQPQVAAQGQTHLQVSKATGAKTGATRVNRLDDKKRVEEIARMLGGIKITTRTLDHAREMIGSGEG
ncbi:MAG: DNA repair protein RecN [Gammaproteobacteria bacterium]|nr:DNA repair protein RecN [Gammaproteobacteria bacterium]